MTYLLQTGGQKMRQKTGVESGGHNYIHAERIFVCFPLRKTIVLETEEEVSAQRGRMCFEIKKKAILHVLK